MERALAEYAAFLAARPSDRTLVEEAKTSRTALAVKLMLKWPGLHYCTSAFALPKKKARLAVLTAGFIAASARRTDWALGVVTASS